MALCVLLVVDVVIVYFTNRVATQNSKLNERLNQLLSNQRELDEAKRNISDVLFKAEQQAKQIVEDAKTKAMEEREKENEYMQKQYSSMNYPMYYNGASQYSNGGGNSSGGGSRNYDGEGRMYYNGGGSSSYANSGGGNGSRGGGSRGYSDGWSVYPIEMRDYREGRSAMSRKNYMEGKEMHHDKAKQMQELEKYIQELSDDVLEMIHDASPEEKMALSQKMTTLANKIK